MSDVRWHEDWRPGHPRPDFADRVMTELRRQEEEAEAGWGARAESRRRAVVLRRGSSVAVLGLAALLITGVALGSLKPGWLQVAWPRAALTDSAQEGAPISKQLAGPVRLSLTTPPAPMEAERPRARRSAATKVKPASPPAAEPPRVVPIHYPPCHCSSGAIVCSCVD